MHSYTFQIVVDARNRWVCFFVNSYRRQDRRLLQIARADFEKVLTRVIEDRVKRVEIAADEARNKFVASVLK